MKSTAKLTCLGLAAGILLAMSGCGGGSKATNTVSVTVVPAATAVIVSQSITLAASVAGSTNTDVTWACKFTTVTTDSTGKQTTSPLSDCTTETGSIPANSTSATVTYTAPSQVPDATKFPGLVVNIVATSVADPKKSGTGKIILDSGIVVTLNPKTATVPTQAQEQFTATLSNDLQNKGVKWLLTQQTPNPNANPPTTFPTLATCSPGCGSIDDNGLYTGPSSVPTTAALTVVATSQADSTRFATGTITVISGGPITYNGITPTVAPQGGKAFDIYIDAPNMTSASVVKVNNGQGDRTIDPSQVKILFPIPSTKATNPPSTGARVRLLEGDLAVAGTYTVGVSDPVQTVTQSGVGPYAFDIIPVRPVALASVPDGLPQNGQSNEVNLALDGGYFGPGGNSATVTLLGNLVAKDSNLASDARKLNLAFDSSNLDVNPGLYSLLVAWAPPTPPSQPPPDVTIPAATNFAVFPDYDPNIGAAPVAGAAIAAGIQPTALQVDKTLGVLAVAATGSNLVQFFSIGGNSLTPIPCPVASCAVNAPTGLSINESNHTVAVVSYQDQSVTVLPVPGATPAPGTPFTISLAGLIPASVSPLPLPYSIGVDPDTNKALVAYSSTATPTTAKVGFLLDLNTDSHSCLDGTTQTVPCVFAQVTLNAGPFPHIAMIPHAHMAYVTPGGAGILSGVDVTKASAESDISSLSATSGVVTVTTASAHGLNPGNPGTVLISGVSPGTTNGVDFNGVFTVISVINSTSFNYVLTSAVNDTASGGKVFYSTPNLTIAASSTTRGIAVNPLTRTAAMADANATGNNGPQIDLLNSLDQVVSSITFHAGCTVYSTSCSNAPELLATTSVDFQPYTNAIVSYNPAQNLVSISNASDLKRYAVISNTGASGAGVSSITVPVNGNNVTLDLSGEVAVDPASNQAFITQPGANTVRVVSLEPQTVTSTSTIKSVHINEVVVPTVSGATIGGIPGATMSQGTLTSASALAGVKILGSGFDSASQVRLDTSALPGGNVQFVSSRQLIATIPASFLAVPHRFSVDVVNGSGVQSNVSDFVVVKAVDMLAACSSTTDPHPSSVAVADQLAKSTFAPVAVVTNSGCNNVSVIDINPQSATFGMFKGAPIAVGANPQGVAISPRFGLAVVANHDDGTASVVNLLTGTLPVPAVTTGTSPAGVAINEGTGAAIVTNTGSNTVSEIDLSQLFAATPATSLTALTVAVDQQPIGVAIDPDRGTNNRGLAVVTALRLNSGSAPSGVLDAIDIGGTTPVKSITSPTGLVTATPNGVVFDPTVSPALFYATSSGGNLVSAFNPDTGGTSAVHVGINPTSLAMNQQTGQIVTVNSFSRTISIVDTLSNPFKTRRTYGIPGSPQFGVAVDTLTNLAVIVDQANNRVLLFPLQ